MGFASHWLQNFSEPISGLLSGGPRPSASSKFGFRLLASGRNEYTEPTETKAFFSGVLRFPSSPLGVCPAVKVYLSSRARATLAEAATRARDRR